MTVLLSIYLLYTRHIDLIERILLSPMCPREPSRWVQATCRLRSEKKNKEEKSKKVKHYMNELPGVDRHEDRDDAGYCGERQHLYLWPGWRIFKTSWLGGEKIRDIYKTKMCLCIFPSWHLILEDHNIIKRFFLGSPPSSQYCHVK